MRIERGDLVLVAAPGDYGKPRPALVVQSNFFNSTHASIVICLISSDIQNAPLFRVDVEPSEDNGLKKSSLIMIDKIISMRTDRIAEVIGHLDESPLLQVNRLLAVFLGLADSTRQKNSI